MIRISYRLNKDGQRANLVAGGDGKSIQTFTLRHGDPCYPDAVTLATEYYDSKASSNYWEVDCASTDGGRLKGLEYSSVPTIDRLLADQRARVEEYELKERAKKAIEDAEAEAGVLELMGKNVEDCLYRDNYGKWDRLAGWWSEPRIAVKGEEVLRERDRRNRQEESEKQAAKDKIELDRKMSMRLWIDQHGSPRLKNCIKEGIKCDGAYYSERLQAEYPNWVKYSALEGTTKDPINPPDEAFALLEEARKEIPSAVLQYYVDDGIKLYCAFAEWPSHPEEIDLVYFGDQDYETQPESDDDEE